MKHRGFVHLVGAGPGAADLLTVRALRLIERAEMIVHDRLVSDEVLDLAPAAAVRINVGKSRGRHCMAQEAINALLVELACAGHSASWASPPYWPISALSAAFPTRNGCASTSEGCEKHSG